MASSGRSIFCARNRELKASIQYPVSKIFSGSILKKHICGLPLSYSNITENKSTKMKKCKQKENDIQGGKNLKKNDEEKQPGEVIEPLIFVEPKQAQPGEVINPLVFVEPKQVQSVEVVDAQKLVKQDDYEMTGEILRGDAINSIDEVLMGKAASGIPCPVYPEVKVQQNFFLPLLPKLPSQRMDLLPAQAVPEEIVKADSSFVTNFTVNPVRQFIFLDREGKEDMEKAVIECSVRIFNISHPMKIKASEIRSLAKTVQKRFPEAILDFEEKNAEKVIEITFRSAMKYCEKTYIYFQAGWQQICGSMRYLHDGVNLGGRDIVKTGMSLPSMPCHDSRTIRDIFERSLSVYQDDVTMPAIFAFSLMGVLYRLFKEAGLTPRFTLFLYGITGSMKTTIARIFFTQMCDEKYRESVRRIDADTAVSLERAIVLSGYDTITLIDDFSPAKTSTKKREMNDKLEMIIRMVGDGSSRSRSNMKLEDMRGEGVQGMVALTGELMGKGLSSNLRCFYCKMDKGLANVESITWFQENPFAYTTLISTFADYVGNNYHFIVDYLQKNMNVERQEISGILTERRLVDSTVILCLAVRIIKDFLVKCCQISEGVAEEHVKRMEAGIMKCAVASQIMSAEESPGVIFIQAVAALMRVNQIVVNTDKVKMSEDTVFDGFEDQAFYFFNPDSIHKKVVDFLNKTNRYFPYEPKEIQAILADERIIQTAPNGSGKRTYCVRITVGNNKKKQGFLKVRKAIFNLICEGNYDIEKGEKE